MNYRHNYHAGSFADVFKHIFLTSLLKFLLRKDKPICYLETHAGIGQYDLRSVASQKTQEYKGGIQKLWPAPASAPDLVSDYLRIVQAWNTQQAGKEGPQTLRYYPGSPRIAQSLLRPSDQLILSELHTRDYALLKKTFARDSQVAVHHVDGYTALKAYLPPKQGRGLVFMDPSFEEEDEFQQLFQHLEMAAKRWATGTYAVWYPVKEGLAVNQFYSALQNSGIREIVYCEFSIPYAVTGMNTCGMVVIRPPWQWCEAIKSVLPWLSKTLAKPGIGRWRFEWLAPE
jgi:23S rRNA (adenine2030-N6)-methyltransferase